MILGFMAQERVRADTRVALVIGNSSYEQVGRLANPSRDAQAIAAALKAVGFDTTLVLDQSRDGMAAALKQFTAKARGADIAAVYYAGHGMEADGQNFLIPTDAELKSDDQIDFELIPLDLVLRSVSGAKQLRLVILDACRNNPFAAQMASTGGTRSVGRGFVRVEPPNNTLVAYAAKEGTTADDGDAAHSPFTTALLKHLDEQGLEVTFLFRKVRDDVLAATGNKQEPGGEPVYLVPTAPAAAAPAPAASLEALFWESIKDSKLPGDYEAYLAQFPNGTFTKLAQARLQQLQPPAPTEVAAVAPPPPAPASAPEIESLQGTFVATQSANVRAEPNTAAKVVGRLAADDSIAVTGKLKDGDWFRVDRDGAAVFVSAKLLRKVDENELKAWRQLNAAPKLEAADAFIAQYPNGYFTPKAQMLKASLRPEQQPAPSPARHLLLLRHNHRSRRPHSLPQRRRRSFLRRPLP
jgi:uncharacterized caspase-like protein